jgi:hypothetical protein
MLFLTLSGFLRSIGPDETLASVWLPSTFRDALAARPISTLAPDHDGKDVRDHQPIDTHMGWHDRFARANELLARAHRDLEHAEDVPQARGLRDRAILHIDEAHRTVDRAWRTARWR